MVVMKKNDYHHGNLKEDYLKIAFDYLKENDVDTLTLKILSDATDTSRSAIYRHFQNKDALIALLIEKGFEQFDAHMAPILSNKNRPLVDRFYSATKAYVEWAKEHPNLYRLLFGNRYAHLRHNIIDIQDDTSITGFHALREAVEEGQEAGIIQRKESYVQSIIIWSSLHGLSSLIIDNFDGVEEVSETLYNDMFESLLAGLITDKVKIISTLPIINTILKPKDKS